MMHIADNQDALLDYLYEEGDPAEHLKIAKHLQECASCSVAVLEFQTVRGVLAEWKPPAPPLGFRIVQDAAESGPAPRTDWWRSGRTPQFWAQAAAAVLLFAAGMAVSQLRMDYRDGAVTLRTQSAQPVSGGMRNASIMLPPETALDPVGSGLSRTDQTSASTEELLQRVRAMIEQSETRQQRELALRLSQVSNEVETQHRADLLRVQQNFGQLEMETGAQITQQQQLMDNLVRTSGSVK